MILRGYCRNWRVAELPATLVGLQRMLARRELSLPDALRAQEQRMAQRGPSAAAY